MLCKYDGLNIEERRKRVERESERKRERERERESSKSREQIQYGHNSEVTYDSCLLHIVLCYK